VEGSNCGLMHDTVAVFVWKAWGNSRKSSDSIVYVSAMIRTWHLRNTSQKY